MINKDDIKILGKWLPFFRYMMCLSCFNGAIFITILAISLWKAPNRTVTVISVLQILKAITGIISPILGNNMLYVEKIVHPIPFITELKFDKY